MAWVSEKRHRCLRQKEAFPGNTVLADLAAVCGRVYKLIRVRELAEFHKLEQMLCILMLEQKAAWKREDGFDRNEAIAERHERALRRLCTDYDPEPFHIELHYDTRRQPNPGEFTVGTKPRWRG